MRRVELDRASRFYSQVIIILLGLITLRLWTLPVGILPAAEAQIPDSGQQRRVLIETARQSSGFLREIRDHLKTGVVRVSVNDEHAHAEVKPSPSKNEQADR